MSLFRAKKGASLSGEAVVALFVKAERERVLKALVKRSQPSAEAEMKSAFAQAGFPVGVA